MNPQSEERAKLLKQFLEAQDNVSQLEEELKSLRLKNESLRHDLVITEETIQNLFSYIQGLSYQGK